MTKLNSQQVGKCGELLVQYNLLKHGVESASLTTDPGIDLVAYHPAKREPVTIQVKTSSHRGPSEDKWILWEIREGCPADYIAIVDWERDKSWLLSIEEFRKEAKHSAKGQLRLWWSLPEFTSKKAKRREESFKDYEIGVVIPKVFQL